MGAGGRVSFGDTVRIALDAAHGFSAKGAALDGRCPCGDGVRQLRVALPQTASPTQIRDAVQAWLDHASAKALFVQRLDHFALLQVQLRKKLSLSNAGTRWRRVPKAMRWIRSELAAGGLFTSGRRSWTMWSPMS